MHTFSERGAVMDFQSMASKTVPMPAPARTTDEDLETAGEACRANGTVGAQARSGP